jgi:hypothetical protein
MGAVGTPRPNEIVSVTEERYVISYVRGRLYETQKWQHSDQEVSTNAVACNQKAERTPEPVPASLEGRRTLPEIANGTRDASDAAGRRMSGILSEDAVGAAASSRGDDPNIISKNDMDRGGWGAGAIAVAIAGRRGGSAAEAATVPFDVSDSVPVCVTVLGSDVVKAAAGGAAEGVGLSRPPGLVGCLVVEPATCTLPLRSPSESTRAKAGCCAISLPVPGLLPLLLLPPALGEIGESASPVPLPRRTGLLVPLPLPLPEAARRKTKYKHREKGGNEENDEL